MASKKLKKDDEASKSVEDFYHIYGVNANLKNKLLKKYHEEYKLQESEQSDTDKVIHPHSKNVSPHSHGVTPHSHGMDHMSTAKYKRGQTAKFATVGIHLYGRGTDPKIKKLDAQYARKEKEITGSDSSSHVNDITKMSVNREHELNYQKLHHKLFKPHDATVKPVKQNPIKINNTVPTVSHTSASHQHSVSHSGSNPSMYNPQHILNRQNTTNKNKNNP